MIISDKIEITINNSNINHYKKYYDNIKNKDKIFVNINELTKGTKYKVKMKCDKCDKILDVPFNILYKNNNIENFICGDCKRLNTVKERYGVDNIFQTEYTKNKSKETTLEKYGVDNISKNEETKNKKIKTNEEKYGVKYILSSNIIKEKSKKTIIEKYGVDNISKSEIFKIKKKETCLKNFGVNYISQHKDFKQNLEKYMLSKLQNKYKNLKNINGDNFTFYCDICSKNFEIYKKTFYTRYNLGVNICTSCNPVGSCHISGLENNIYNFIYNNTNYNIIRSNRDIIKPYELDIYVPELKIAFEFNGLFWHNENNLSKKYHLNKTEECEKQGIKLIHIWEDDWLYKQNIVKSIILNKLGKPYIKIMARKCEIREISDNILVRDFLETEHEIMLERKIYRIYDSGNLVYSIFF